MKVTKEVKVKAEKKEREFPQLKQEVKNHSTACAIWFISSSRKEQENRREIGERARLPARISHTLVLLPGKAGAAGAFPAPMTK